MSPCGDGRKLTERALARASYIRESSTTFYLRRWTGLAGKECVLLRLLQQHSRDLLQLDLIRSPSKTSWRMIPCDRTRNRTNEPILGQLTCHLERRTCQTGDFWLQNKLERNWLSASDLRVKRKMRRRDNSINYSIIVLVVKRSDHLRDKTAGFQTCICWSYRERNQWNIEMVKPIPFSCFLKYHLWHVSRAWDHVHT